HFAEPRSRRAPEACGGFAVRAPQLLAVETARSRRSSSVLPPYLLHELHPEHVVEHVQQLARARRLIDVRVVVEQLVAHVTDAAWLLNEPPDMRGDGIQPVVLTGRQAEYDGLPLDLGGHVVGRCSYSGIELHHRSILVGRCHWAGCPGVAGLRTG